MHFFLFFIGNSIFFYLYHELLAPIGTDGFASCLLFGVGFRFFVVTPRMFYILS